MLRSGEKCSSRGAQRDSSKASGREECRPVEEKEKSVLKKDIDGVIDYKLH